MAGSGRYVVVGETVDMRAGSLVWLFPMQEHVLMERAPDLEMWNMVFRPGLLRNSAVRIPELIDGPRGVVHTVISGRNLQVLDAVARDIAECTEFGDRHMLGLSWWLLSAWEASVKEDGREEAPLHPAVAQTMRLIRDDPSADLLSLAREVGLSPCRLSRLFSQQVGANLTRYRNRLRLETFFHEFETGQAATMLAAALNAGFGSYAQFNRIFHQHMGCSPTTYQKEARHTQRRVGGPLAETRPRSRRAGRNGASSEGQAAC